MISAERWRRRGTKPSLLMLFFGWRLNRPCAQNWDATLDSLWKRISVSSECAIGIRNFTKRCSRTRARGHRQYDSVRQSKLTQKAESRDCGAQLALRGRAGSTGRIIDEIVARRSRCG